VLHNRLRDARIGDSVISAVSQSHFILDAQGTPVGDDVVFVMSEEVKEVFLQIRRRATDRVDFVGANHLGQDSTDLGGTHRSSHRQKHLAVILLEKFLEAFSGGQGFASVEMAVMPLHELADLHSIELPKN
jgi:hypothetical protein